MTYKTWTRLYESDKRLFIYFFDWKFSRNFPFLIPSDEVSASTKYEVRDVNI